MNRPPESAQPGMTDYDLVKTRFAAGVWEGVVTARTSGAPAPDIVVSVLDRTLEGVQLVPSDEPGAWSLRIPVPADAIGEGVQTFLIRETSGDEVLARFSIAAGEILDDDIAAELSLLRAELDMLKRAFRRHCREAT